MGAHRAPMRMPLAATRGAPTKDATPPPPATASVSFTLRSHVQSLLQHQLFCPQYITHFGPVLPTGRHSNGTMICLSGKRCSVHLMMLCRWQAMNLASLWASSTMATSLLALCRQHCRKGRIHGACEPASHSPVPLHKSTCACARSVKSPCCTSQSRCTGLALAGQF